MMGSKLSNEDVTDLAKNVRENPPSSIDGGVWGSAIDVACDCALKPRELREASVGDYTPRNEDQPAKLKIRGGREREIELPPYAEETVERHIKALQKNNYPLSADAPLLPKSKSGVRFEKRTFQRRIEKIQEIMINFTMEEIRQAGIRKYYDWTGTTPNLRQEQRRRMTADYAGVSEQHVEDVLKGEVQVAGVFNPRKGERDKFNPPDLRTFRKSFRNRTETSRRKALDNFDKILDYDITGQRNYKKALESFIKECQEDSAFEQKHLDVLKEFCEEHDVELTDDEFWARHTGVKVKVKERW